MDFEVLVEIANSDTYFFPMIEFSKAEQRLTHFHARKRNISILAI